MKRLLPLMLLLSGCMTLRESVIRTASFNEKCPPEKIQFLRMSPDQMTAEVNACGRFRRYHDMTTYVVDSPNDPNWVDITEQTAVTADAGK